MRKCLWLRVHLLFLSALLSSLSYAQDRQISGIVSDEKNAALTGATVSVKGTTIVASTDVNGKFSLTLPRDRKTLLVTYVGMQPREVTVGKDDLMVIALNPSGNEMQVLVVVGYGNAKKENLTLAKPTVSARALEEPSILRLN